MNKSIRVLLIADEPVIAAGLRAMLATDPTFLWDTVERSQTWSALDLVIVKAGTLDSGRVAEQYSSAGVPTLSFGTPELPRTATASEVVNAARRAARVMPDAGTDTACRIHLTRRENEVLALVAQGLRNKEIACRLRLTAGTVKMYLAKLFEKVGARDRYELALYALQTIRRSDLVLAARADTEFALLRAMRDRRQPHDANTLSI